MKRYQLVIWSVLALSGCSTMATNILFAGIDRQLVGKDYPRYPTSSKNVEAYKQALVPFDKSVTTDEKGSYYIELAGDDGVYMTGLKTSDSEVLKSLLSTSVGLLEPLYKYGKSGAVQLNKYGTDKRHEYLTKNIGLKLLPLAETHKYHEFVKNHVTTEVDRITNGNGFSGLSGIGSGNRGIYNKTYYDKITTTITKNFSYLVQNPGVRIYTVETESEMTKAISKKREREFIANSTDPRAKYRSTSEESAFNKNAKFKVAAINISNMYDIYFVPLEFYKTAKRNIAYNLGSGCRYTDFEQLKAQYELQESVSAVPYFSAISALSKAKGKEEQVNSRASFNAAFDTQGQIRTDNQKACLIGLKALDVNGAIESRRLN